MRWLKWRIIHERLCMLLSLGTMTHATRCASKLLAPPWACGILKLVPDHLLQVAVASESDIAKCLRYGAWAYSTHDHTINKPEGVYTKPEMEPGLGVRMPF
jgi:hypothetical protein